MNNEKRLTVFPNLHINSESMIIHYLKTTFRNSLRNKVSSAISIIGLATGLASVMMIFLYVRHETSFDTQHSKANRIFHIILDANTGNEADNNSETPFPLIPEIRNKYPEVEVATRIYASSATVKSGTKLFAEKNVIFAEPEFLKVFDVTWIHGNPAMALDDVNEVVVTRSTAMKMFGGTAQAMDKVFTLEGVYPLKVSGVVEDPLLTTHLPYTMLISLKTLSKEYFVSLNYDQWNGVFSGFHAYVLLKSKKDAPLFQAKIKNLRQIHMIPNSPSKKTLRLQPLKEIHYGTNLTSFNYTTSKTSLWIISIIGLITLFIAAFNYLNMTIAHSIKRSKEVGIKRSAGACKRDILIQFLAEAVVMTIFCLVVAVILVEIFLPTLNQYLGNGIELSLYRDYRVIFLCLILVLAVAALTGIYPGLIVSSYSPVDAIKSKISSPKRSINFLKNGLLTLQFIISLVLIIGTLTIYLQLKFIEKKELGFTKENVIQIPLPDPKRADFLRSELISNPSISEVSSAASPPQSKDDFRFTSYYYEYGGDKKNARECEIKSVGIEYLRLFKLQLVAGEWLRKRGPNDSILMLVVNQTLLKQMGWTPQQAIGKRLNYGVIIGVITDFHAESLQKKIMPAVMVSINWAMQFTFVKVNGKIGSTLISDIQKTWEKAFPNQVFTCSVYEEYIQEMYFRENRAFDIVRLFAIISIIIAYLGVFGMVSFLVAQKTHEFCMRKVLGATGYQLFFLISRNYLQLLLLANIIAWPVSWYLMNRWLDEFAYRITISWWIFAIAMAITMAITLLTVFSRTVKVATMNPAEVLKYE